MEKPQLISFETCPFVQRSVITLLEKGVDFDVTYIDLANKPEWFLKISPFGKVPVLKVGDEVLFESAVINEYLNEVYPPDMHPENPLQKAKNRAWIEFESGLNMAMFQWAMAPDEKEYLEKQQKMIEQMERVEEQLGDGPFFNGEKFSLIDTAFAPFYMRMRILEEKLKLGIMDKFPKQQAYSTALLAKESVQKSVKPDTISVKFINYVKEKPVYMASLL